MLADLLRTDRHAHRPLPDDTVELAALRVLARAHQDAVWHRQQTAGIIYVPTRKQLNAITQYASTFETDSNLLAVILPPRQLVVSVA